MWQSRVQLATWSAHAAGANQKNSQINCKKFNAVNAGEGNERVAAEPHEPSIRSCEQCIPGGEQGGRLGFRTADLVEEPAGLRASPKESDPAAQKYWEQVVQKYWGVDACFKHTYRL